MTVKLAVFDCDGTLSDGQAAICAAMAEGFAEAGLAAPDPHQVRRIVGLSLPSAVARLAPEHTPEAHARVVAAYKHAYFNARLTNRFDLALSVGRASKKRALGWTRRANEKRGRAIRWNDGVDPTSTAYSGT